MAKVEVCMDCSQKASLPAGGKSRVRVKNDYPALSRRKLRVQTFSRLHADWNGGLGFERGCHEFSDGIVGVLFGVLKVLLVLMATMGLVGRGSHTGMSLVWEVIACMAFWGMCVKLWLLSLPKSFATNYRERAVELLDRYEAQCPAEKAEILAFLKGRAAKGEDGGGVQAEAVFGDWIGRERSRVEPMWKAAAKKWDSGEV